MDVTVSLEARFYVTSDGRVWSDGGIGLRFWHRYLEVFDRVRIVARQVPVATEPSIEWMQVNDDDNVVFHGVPDYHGPLEYLRRAMAVEQAVRKAAAHNGAVILRVPSQIGARLEYQLRRRGRPYALEVVGDPYDVFAPGAVRHPLRPLFRHFCSRQLRGQCCRALAVAYVTQKALQQRYPTKGMSVGVSDIRLRRSRSVSPTSELDGDSVPSEIDCVSIAEEARKPKYRGPYCLCFVGTLAQLYKAPDVLVEALAQCVRRDLDVRLVIAGDGGYRPVLAVQAERLGLASRVRFVGHVPAGKPIQRFLDEADLFILPSRQEGLPRAMVEAMARGLPCIGSAVGGIPELLGVNELVPVGDSGALAAKIEEVLSNPSRMELLSRRNLAKANEYREDLLSERRWQFYRYVRDMTERWGTTRQDRQ